MSNYTARIRSNYFAVKDEAAFREFCETYSLNVITERARDGRDLTLVGFYAANDQGIPSGYYGEDEEFIHSNFLGELADLLVEGDVALVMEVGNVKSASLSAQAVALNGRGEQRRVDIDEIYERAAGLGERMTRCEE